MKTVEELKEFIYDCGNINILCIFHNEQKGGTIAHADAVFEVLSKIIKLDLPDVVKKFDSDTDKFFAKDGKKFNNSDFLFTFCSAFMLLDEEDRETLVNLLSMISKKVSKMKTIFDLNNRLN